MIPKSTIFNQMMTKNKILVLQLAQMILKSMNLEIIMMTRITMKMINLHKMTARNINLMTKRKRSDELISKTTQFIKMVAMKSIHALMKNKTYRSMTPKITCE